ncbi:MAG TPA: hypothetical protein VFI25_16865 [Planctomycetota bacterium]|jgi:putative aminopeptidase FrvX|nr:hypothetical protein [Planctomycetota bacterium]
MGRKVRTVAGFSVARLATALPAACAGPAFAQPPDELETWLQELSEAPGPSGFEEDAGPIHRHGLGVPTLDLAIPQRSYHAANGVIHRDDVEAAIRLAAAIAERMDRAALERILPPLPK